MAIVSLSVPSLIVPRREIREQAIRLMRIAIVLIAVTLVVSATFKLVQFGPLLFASSILALVTLMLDTPTMSRADEASPNGLLTFIRMEGATRACWICQGVLSVLAAVSESLVNTPSGHKVVGGFAAIALVLLLAVANGLRNNLFVSLLALLGLQTFLFSLDLADSAGPGAVPVAVLAAAIGLATFGFGVISYLRIRPERQRSKRRGTA